MIWYYRKFKYHTVLIFVAPTLHHNKKPKRWFSNRKSINYMLKLLILLFVPFSRSIKIFNPQCNILLTKSTVLQHLRVFQSVFRQLFPASLPSALYQYNHCKMALKEHLRKTPPRAILIKYTCINKIYIYT